MNFETFTILIEPREVHECINANTHTIVLKSTSNRCYEFNIALPCTNTEICRLLSMYNNFEVTRANRYNERFVSIETFNAWTIALKEALDDMRFYQNFKKDLEELGPSWRDSQLQLVKYMKNKYQYGLKETKEMVDLYYISTDSN